MNIFEVTMDNYMEIPLAKSQTIYNEVDPDIERYDSFLIIPSPDLHDSGWQCMHFVGCRGNEAVALYCGFPDIVHLNGIGGYGRAMEFSKLSRPIGWKIDCTPSGIIRIHCNGILVPENIGRSDFDLFVEDKRRKTNG